jgi:hypothetical protein
MSRKARSDGFRMSWRWCLTLALLAVTLASGPSAEAAPGGWQPLTERLPPGSSIYDLWISPNSQTVVFIASLGESGLQNLYSVPIVGGDKVQLNPSVVAGGYLDLDVLITPDSAYVLYLAIQDVQNRRELYRVPIGGGPSVPLSGSLVSGGNVHSFLYEAGSQRVVFLADNEVNETFELFGVPIGGGPIVKLNPSLPAGRDVQKFLVDPVGQRVVYTADQDIDNRIELYSASVFSGAALKLNQAEAETIADFRLAPGYAYVVYTALLAGGTYELFGNDTTGGTPRSRNYILFDGERVVSFQISSDGTRIVYLVTSSGVKGKLYVTSSFAGASRRVTQDSDPALGALDGSYAFTPDASRVVYAFQQNAASPLKLYSVNTDGLFNYADLYTQFPNHYVWVQQISADGQWVLVADQAAGAIYLRTVPVGGGSSVLHGTGGYTGLITLDSSRVIFTNWSSTGRPDLISTQIFGGDWRNLSSVRTGEYAVLPVVPPNGQGIVYVVVLNTGELELRISDGQAAPALYEVYVPLALH